MNREPLLTIKIQAFGALREYIKDSHTLEVPIGETLYAIRTRILQLMLKDNPEVDLNIMRDCAIGNESQVLEESSRIWEDCELALLPPVCGG